MRKFLKIAILSVVCGLVVSMASPAEAGFRLRVEDTTAGVGAVITDDGTGDGFTGLGKITFVGKVGAFDLAVTVGTAAPPLTPSPDAFAQLHLGVIASKSGTSAATLRVTLENDGFTAGPDGPLLLRGELTAGLASGATITGNGYVNAGNSMPALGADTFPVAALGAIGAIPAGSVAAWTPDFTGPGISIAPWTKSGAYALFSQASLSYGATGGTSSYDLDLRVMPEPSSLVLALAGIPLLGLRYRRRLKGQPQQIL